ncbi:Sigma-54 dependent transcriptional regulator [Candidatus Bealeia paramacronuclearis]|uniref:Sigma-54 dependent transcriptional regulator n=1 Tax=Candidatus Bealeia paramacronuclearis TaxID=1921001 RepID=A0ABZ2C1A5_9PROT|nr:Sigma-54 dependent transcriptional regulator [Candidatus Bealeia paramacronuclearis]
MEQDILIVDDEKDIRSLISGILEDEGYKTRTASDGQSALDEINKRQPHLLILDIWLGDPQYDGLKLLEMIRKSNPTLPVVMISGHGTIETAVKAIKLGAYEFIEKPFKTDRLLLVTARALETAQLRQENTLLKKQFHEETQIVGESPALAKVKKTIEKVAPTASRIMISGPMGCGKELVAREIHRLSARVSKPFYIIHCASLSPETLEAELFGIEGKKIGILEQAHGGSLYLDEVTDLTPEIQSKLMQVLQAQTFKRVGGTQIVQVDVRILSSTKKDIKAEIEAGRFREDLFYRLSVVPIEIPPLSQRRDDIPFLIEHLTQIITKQAGVSGRLFSEPAMLTLKAHNWPGNVRELRNVVERLMIMTPAANDEIITPDELPLDVRSEDLRQLQKEGTGVDLLSLPLKDAREHFEREYLLAQVNKFSGNISRTATFIGMERSALHRKLRTLQVDRKKEYGT